jgi:hypothetical protein
MASNAETDLRRWKAKRQRCAAKVRKVQRMLKNAKTAGLTGVHWHLIGSARNHDVQVCCVVLKIAKDNLDAALPEDNRGDEGAKTKPEAAINHIGCKILKIPMTCYFGDFTVMTQESLKGGTRLSVETLFTTLGLNLSSSDKKNLDFAKAFNVLGVAFDLNINPDDSFMIRNTESRVSDLVSRISRFWKRGSSMPRTPRGSEVD